MGIIDGVTNMFTVLGTGLYVLYRKFVIAFEIPSSSNFKEKIEYLSCNPKKHFFVLIGEDSDDIAKELNVWFHFAVLLFCNTVLFTVLNGLGLRIWCLMFVLPSFSLLTWEFIHLKSAKITILSYCLIASFVLMFLIRGPILIKSLIVFMLSLIMISITAEFCGYFGKVLKNVLLVRIDLPNRATDYCEVIFKNGEVLSFSSTGFYPVICEDKLCIYNTTGSLPAYYTRKDVESFLVTGHSFKSQIVHRKLEL